MKVMVATKSGTTMSSRVPSTKPTEAHTHQYSVGKPLQGHTSNNLAQHLGRSMVATQWTGAAREALQG